MDRTVPRIALGVALAACVLASGGCSCESRADVTGRVTYNGTPLGKPGGQIVFVGARGTQVVAEIAPDGAYRAVGVSTGPNRVAVYYPNPEVKNAKPFPSKPKPGQPPPPAPTPAHVAPFLTPTKYASAETSELSAEVSPGTVFDVTLKGPKIP